MPCTDPRDVSCLEEAFDLTTPSILPWELELIWSAVALDVMILSNHAWRAAADESIPKAAVWRVVREGRPSSKDISSLGFRKVGINFEGKIRGGRRIRAKVSWQLRYVVATVHTL
jgi:hypothetical protein